MGQIGQQNVKISIRTLRRLLSPTVHVLRDGEERRILAEEVVPGDLLLLVESDRVAADGRLVEAAELQTDQST